MLALANELHARGHVVHLFLRHPTGALLQELHPAIALHDAGGRRALALSGWLARGVKRHRVQVLYSGTNAMNLAAGLALLRMAPDDRPAHLLSEHTTPTDYLAQAKWPALRRLAMRRLYGRADRLVAPLDGLAQAWLDDLGLNVSYDGDPDAAGQGTTARHTGRRHRVTAATLPNPVLAKAVAGVVERTDDLTDPTSVHIPSANRRGGLIAVGRLHPDKGFDRLIDAMALMGDDAPQLDIWGEGDRRAELEAQIAARGLTERVRLAGITRDLPTRLAAARLLIVPSRREGFGNVVIESLASGTPVVATNCAGPVALLAQAGAAGRVVDQRGPDVADRLAHAIQAALRDPDTLPDAARLGPGIAAPFTVDAATDAFLNVVQEVQAQRCRPEG